MKIHPLKNILMFICVLLIVSCDQDDQQTITQKQKFNAPQINKAKEYFNNNFKIPQSDNYNFQKSSSSISPDWDNSKAKVYKESSTLDVDILYTPIYIKTATNAKAFIASVTNDGIIESKIFCVLYKEDPFGSNGLSAYVFRYSVQGTFEKAYNLENGIQVPFDDNQGKSSINTKSSEDCNVAPSGADFDVMQEWLETCGFMLDDVRVVGDPTDTTIDAGSSSVGGLSDSSNWPGFGGIPFDGSPQYNAGNGYYTVSPIPFMPNLVSAGPISIAQALELPTLSLEALWLQQQSQQILQAIANFLNANKAKETVDSDQFPDVNDSQIPNIDQNAIDFLINYINFMIDNPNSGFEIDSDVDNNFVQSFYTNNLQNFVVFEDIGESINLSEVLECFNNPPVNATFNFTLYVDQPVENSDEAWTNDGDLFNPDINVGHTFFSLTMNTGSSSITQTIGFYPSEGVSPVSPQTSGTWVDDGGHPFDVSISINLNQSNFLALISNLESGGTPNYNLNDFNCTDAALNVGNNAGITLPDTQGSWPGGGGSNPGNLGQDIRDLDQNQNNTNNNGGLAPQSNGSC